MKEDLVSIIMPAYNSDRYIAASIESIISQTYRNLEILITDDGSTDNTTDIVKKYMENDDRIKLFHSNGNNGAGAARNISLSNSKGRYIAFCDSDDTWLPDKIEKQISFMNESKCCFCFSSYYVCNANGCRTGVVVAPEKVSLIGTKRDDKIGFLTAIYDTSFHGKFFMPIIRKRQDWAYVLQILQKCGYAYGIKEPLACYRRARGSISHNKFKLVKYNAKVYQIVFGYSKIKSYLYLFLLFLPTYFYKVLNNKLVNVTGNF